MCVCVCVCVCVWKPSQKIKINFSTLDVLIIFSFLLVLISDLNSQLNQIGYASLLLLYIIIRFSGKLNYTILYYSVLGASIILSVTGYLQYSGLLNTQNEEYRVLGPFYNPAPYGCMISVFSSVIATVLIENKLLQLKKKIKYFSWAVFTLSIPVLVFANSRASWLALFTAILFAFFHKHKSALIKMSVSKKVILFVIALIVSFSIFSFLYDLRSESIKGRILIWKISFKMIEDKPLFGFGNNGFEANYMNYQAEFFKSNKGTEQEKILADNIRMAYNEPLRITVEYGIFGLLLYSLVIYLVLIKTKNKNLVLVVSKSVLIVLLVFGLFSYPNQIFSIQAVAIIALGCLINTRKLKTIRLSIRTFSIRLLNASIVLLLMLFMTFIFNQHKAYFKFQELLSPQNYLNDKKVLVKLKGLEKPLSKDALFLYYYCLILGEKRKNSLLLEKMQLLERLSPTSSAYVLKGDCFSDIDRNEDAEKAYLKAYYMVPSLQLARTKLAMLYKKQGKVTQAKALAEEVLSEKVKFYGFQTYRLHQKLKEILEEN